MKLSEKLGLGTVQFGLKYGISNTSGKTSANDVQKIIALARNYQVDTLDSASAYGNAEEVLGKSNLDGFKVVSKFLPDSLGLSIKEQLSSSLRNLGTKTLYGYLAHRPMDLLDHPEQWEELQALKAEGKVDKIGFSLYEPKEIEKLLKKGFTPDLIQVPYNYFDRRFESAILNLKKTGCEIHTRSAFMQGLFFMNPDDLQDHFNIIKPQLIKLQKNKPLNGAILKFVLEKPFIDKVIIGVENEEQLKLNIQNIENAPSLPEFEETLPDNILIPSEWPKN